MKRVVLGTAGHIDHGKTLLTKALTGVDTDRLAEEKARGMTIELGFAPMILEDGTEISLVDVPGHEKFVRTMMAGVTGIDGVLLVIAADDGVMPQTREHFNILCLLGLKRGIVVLTKTDLVSPERLAAVEAQVAELVRDSFLENAPVCPVSAVSGAGIEALRGEIGRLVQSAEERNSGRPFRMSVDRAFPVSGFGTVAAGTLTGGTVRVGDTVEVQPAAVRGTVRTLQTHGTDEAEAMAGVRAAMSFSGLPKDVLRRGCTLAEPDSLMVTDLLTVRIEILDDCPYLIRNSSQMHLFHGTEEQVCKLRLLDSDSLRAGQSGFAQLKLAQPIPVRWDDRFLLRFFSPVLTVGGGTVLACGGTRLRRNHPPVLERLRRLADDSGAVRLAQRIGDPGLVPVSREALRRYGNLSAAEYGALEQQVISSGQAVEILPGMLLSAEAAERRLEEAISALTEFHGQYPLQPGMDLARWRGSLFPEPGAPVNALLERWTAAGRLKVQDHYVALPDFEPVFTQEHKIMQRKLLHYYREAWFFAPDLKAVKEKFQRFGTLFEQVLANMRLNGMLIPLSPRYWVHFEAYRDALRIFGELSAGGQPVTLAQFRTAAQISRKYAQLFLEYWDRNGVSRRVGDAHVPTEKK